jgi:outer membrane receptor protein involved in Fe transport
MSANKVWLNLALTAATALMPMYGHGQARDSGDAAAASGLDEIVVTATRRQERLQDVPISVSAFSQERMDSQGLRDIDNLARLAPGINFSRNGSGSSANYNDENSDISIRGIQSTAGTSTTGIYIDDTPIQSRHIAFGTLNAFPVLFDLDRVEVLRGPQGTLFGAGSEGGTVRFISPEPGLRDYSGYLRSEGASIEGGGLSYEAGAAVGGPIVADELGFRVSASYRRDGGWVNRVDPRTGAIIDKDSNWHETFSFRAALKWQPWESLAITPSLYYQELTIHDTAAFWPRLSDPGATQFVSGGALPNAARDPLYLANVKVDADLGAMRLSSNTAYYSRHQYATTDFTQFDRIVYGLGAPYAPIPLAGDHATDWNADRQDNFFEEVRLQSATAQSRGSWSVGLFYSHIRENNPETIVDPTLDAEYSAIYGSPFCTPAAPCPGGQIYTQNVFRVLDRQIAAFAEGSLSLTDALKLTAGLRVSDVQTTGDAYFYGPFVGAGVGPATPIASGGQASERPVTPKLVFSYEPDRDRLVYLSAAKGFRIGGINADVGSVCGADLTSIGLSQVPGQYRSDSLWSYEFGAKNTLMSNQLVINASVFMIDWRNIQQNVYLPTCGQQFTANLGRVRSSGGDLEIQFRPTIDLQLGLTAAYVDARYTATVCAGQVACTGNGAAALPVVSTGDRLPGAPWTVAISGEYVLPPLHDARPYVRVDAQLATAQTASLANQDPNNGVSDPTIPGLPQFTTVALRGGVRLSGVDLSLFAQNLTNAHPVLFRSRDTTASTLYYERSLQPRTLGITCTYRF